ncbi:MAG: co-chaperone GroES [Verrucomicrobia bacterium]|nr:co-chaperone GroES [Verrucomicrobiota bacterium]
MSTKKIKPLGNRIVVRRKEAKTTKGGILLPEAAQEKPRQGEVIAVGPGKMDEKGRFRALELKAGDEIFFSSYAGTEYKTDDGEFLILSEDDVLAVVK